MTKDQKVRLAATIAGGLIQAEASVQSRMLAYLHKVDLEYAERVSAAMVAMKATSN